MKVHPVVVHQNGIVSVTMQASFIGDVTDTTDQQRIQAYGDPLVNLGGLFTDPNNPAFQFTFPAQELYVGVTTAMQGNTARFMMALPQVAPPANAAGYAVYQPQPNCPTQGPLDCLTSDPVHAATIWASAIDTRITTLMAVLRAKTPAALTSLADTTV